MNDKIHKELSTMEIYEKLRCCHSLLKDVFFMDNFEKLSEEKKNAIESLSGVMYMTEHYFTDF